MQWRSQRGGGNWAFAPPLGGPASMGSAAGGGQEGSRPQVLEKLISIHSAPPPDFGGFCKHTLEFYQKRIKNRKNIHKFLHNLFKIFSKFSKISRILQNFFKIFLICLINIVLTYQFYILIYCIEIFKNYFFIQPLFVLLN